MKAAVKAIKKATEGITAGATGTRPAGHDGEDTTIEALARAREQAAAGATFFCKEHGAIPASEAIKTKGGRNQCPRSNCLRFIGPNPGTPGKSSKNDEGLLSLEGIPITVAGDEEVRRALRALALVRIRRATMEAKTEMRGLEALQKLEPRLEALDEMEGNITWLSEVVNRLATWLAKVDELPSGKGWALTGTQEKS